MTIAIDRTSGAIVGQVCDRPRSARVEAYRERHLDEWVVRILTRDGRYQYVPASSVRIEVLR